MAKKAKVRAPKMLSRKDTRLTTDDVTHKQAVKKDKRLKKAENQVTTKVSSTTMYLSFNMALGPPFQVICDTNFINFSVRNKMDIRQCLMNCLLAKVVPLVTECVLAELQKLGSKFKLALKTARQFDVLPCMHKGTYADDCIVGRVEAHKCYIVGTCDRDLKRRIRKIPGIPIMFIARKQYVIERMPDAYGMKK